MPSTRCIGSGAKKKKAHQLAVGSSGVLMVDWSILVLLVITTTVARLVRAVRTITELIVWVRRVES